MPGRERAGRRAPRLTAAPALSGHPPESAFEATTPPDCTQGSGRDQGLSGSASFSRAQASREHDFPGTRASRERGLPGNAGFPEARASRERGLPGSAGFLGARLPGSADFLGARASWEHDFLGARASSPRAVHTGERSSPWRRRGFPPHLKSSGALPFHACACGLEARAPRKPTVPGSRRTRPELRP